jgi:nitrate/nitrite-specific signal transduction histidine kinase
VSAEEKGRSYIEGARLELNQYAQSLLRENERLRALTATLESEKRQLELNAGQAVNELERLKTKYDVIENENYQYLEQYHQIEQQSSNLSNLYVASYQLHSSVDRDVVLTAIQEIVINLIGSEEVAIFVENGEGKFDLASCFGLEPSLLRPFSLGEGPIGQALARGEVSAENFPMSAPSRFTACVPLKINDTIIGAIVVFRLLPHKTALERVDHELFELLAIHASTALYCATLHADLCAKAEVAS